MLDDPDNGVNLCGDPMWTDYLGPTAIEKQIAFMGHERGVPGGRLKYDPLRPSSRLLRVGQLFRRST
jgi:hypothetical protein